MAKPTKLHLAEVKLGKHPASTKRSSKWTACRRTHLAQNPCCAVCGGNKKVEVHHVKPFHLHPDLELNPTNFISLCENMKDGLNCHLAFGHLGNFKSFNVDVRTDAATWAKKIETRPLA